MYTVFVIGNIASGKSTAARYLEMHGGRLIDLDQLAKTLYQPGSDLIIEIADTFGSDVLDDDGCIITARLAQRAFASPEATSRLNALVHPRLLQKLADILVEPQCCAAAPSGYLFTVVEISVAASFVQAFPLADEVIAITAPLELRRERAVERGMASGDFDRRAEVQPSEEELCALASVVIDNSAADDSLFAELDAWLEGHGFVACNQERASL